MATDQPSCICARCGRRDLAGHGCDRVWRLPFGVRVGHCGFKRSTGGLSNAYWSLYWAWRGDTHVFNPNLSFGEHRNLSEMSRRERQACEDLPSVDSLDDGPICDGEFAGPNACVCGHSERHV